MSNPSPRRLSFSEVVAEARLLREMEQLAVLENLATLLGFNIRQNPPEKFPERNAEVLARAESGQTVGEIRLAMRSRYKSLTDAAIKKIIQRGRRKLMGT